MIITPPGNSSNRAVFFLGYFAVSQSFMTALWKYGGKYFDRKGLIVSVYGNIV